MTTLATERLREIKTLSQLVAYLRDELDWPISSNNTEDITFDYEPSELGLDKETAVKIKEIKQLRPLTGNQPWGIFFVNFEKKRLPVMVMRRILRSLVFKKRISPGKSDRQAWHASDLLFISAYGEEHDRAITFAHFVEDEELGGLAELRVLGWDDDDTPLKYDYVAHTLHDKFRWRGPFERDPDMWRKTWRDAFELRHREVITTSKQLALSLAALAKKIRSRVRSILRYEDGFGQIRKLQTAFRKALIHDLSDDDFADMYAQTITYGLFSARVSRPAGIRGENIIDMVPVTNPFLRDMLETFLNLSGRKGKIDFDELGIQQVTALLNDTNVEAILRDFGRLARREDPVIHFYEDFLREYDAEKRIKRGVFYTPQPVVSYIVRSVHELLQTEFKLADGLADTITWGEMVRRTSGLKLPNVSGDRDHYQPISESEPFVQILDPAVGTATFLVEVIDVIYFHLKTKWDHTGFKEMPELPATSFPRQPADFSEYWNQYVAFSLLRRLHGFELMMAPYAIAHMKVGLKLWETGYRFAANERAHIYLTNSLEPPSDIQRDLPQLSPALAHEARAVNEVKRKKRFAVVIGNPPYSISSANNGEWIRNLVAAYKTGLDEINVNALSDDYLKFLRLAEYLVTSAGIGTLGMITNNSYLEGTLQRKMRNSFLQTFDVLFILDLHGSSKAVHKSELGQTPDENVFDIKQGVAIGLFLRHAVKQKDVVSHRDSYGARTDKYQFLNGHSVGVIRWQPISPTEPYFFFKPKDLSAAAEYNSGWSIVDIFPVASTGINFRKDNLLVKNHFRRSDVVQMLNDIRSLPRDQLLTKYCFAETSDWQLKDKKRLFDPQRTRDIQAIAYRPLDCRFTYYPIDCINQIIVRGDSRVGVAKDMLSGRNVALITKRSRMINVDSFCHTWVVNNPPDGNYLADRTYFAPLYTTRRQDELFENGDVNGNTRSTLHPNLSAQFIPDIAKGLGLEFTDNPLGDLHQTFGPRDILNYIYAVLHSPTYRSRYAEFLKIDFPRLPLTTNLELFRGLAKLGTELVGLHLLVSPKLDKPGTEFIGGRNPEVEKVSYSKNTVWIDRALSAGFRGVPEEVWNFHIGGYQVCEKWLKDRKDRTLSKADIAHYNKIVVALAETIRLMTKIDNVIEKHGGWPGAFAVKTESKEQ